MTEIPQAGRVATSDSGSNPTPPKPASCWISFGGNVGDVKATFDAALALLSLHCNIELGRRSGIFRTAPVGAQAGCPFLNSVCGLTTTLSPRNLLSVLQSVETQLGRVREIRWGPRTLDLDLLSYGDKVVCEPDLIVPHPSVAYRRFVLDPLVEVDPGWRHPVIGDSADELLQRLKTRPLKVCLVDIPHDQSSTLAGQFSSKFPHLQWINDSDGTDGALIVRKNCAECHCKRVIVDLRHSPGDIFEQLTSVFTSIFDAPERSCEWQPT